MLIAPAVNLLAMVFGFCRIARRDRLLDNEVVQKHVWEHALLAVLSITNLDTLNLLAWRSSRFNGFPIKPVESSRNT